MPELLSAPSRGCEQVLVVLEHQPLGRVAVHRVVRRADLEQLVEPRNEVDPALPGDVRHRRADKAVLELTVTAPGMQPHSYALYKIAQLAQDVLRQQSPIVTKRFDVRRNRIGRALDLFVGGTHPYASPSFAWGNTRPFGVRGANSLSASLGCARVRQNGCRTSTGVISYSVATVCSTPSLALRSSTNSLYDFAPVWRGIHAGMPRYREGSPFREPARLVSHRRLRPTVPPSIRVARRTPAQRTRSRDGRPLLRQGGPPTFEQVIERIQDSASVLICGATV